MARTVVFYISGHGFGHAARQVELVNAILARRPSLHVVLRTAAPPWFFELTVRGSIDLRPLECDTGIVQHDSLELDAAESIGRAAAFHRDLAARASAEAGVLRDLRADLVVGDIPPLAFAAADHAELPSIAIGNFTWDWIYAGYPELTAREPDFLATIALAYRTATLGLRLPMCGGFGTFGPMVRDIPFIARHAARTRAAVCTELDLPQRRPLVLISFGGHGLERLDAARLGEARDYTFVMTDTPNRPQSAEGSSVLPGNVFRFAERAIYDRGLRYEDLVAAADVVVTKPGYGIISEAVANRTAILYTSRGRFVEYDVLVAAMPSIVRSRFIGHDDLFAGRWADHLDRLMAQPPAPERPPTDGAEKAADIVLAHLD